ncbi:MAG TPA: Smr/MutS family protein [Dehalococcoidales bacterium]|nr:Smr/MutS family protein [Dehalococcoidales bacterium]
MAAVQNRLQSPVFQPPQMESKRAIDDRIKPGDTVWMKDAGLEGTVVTVDERNNEVELQAGKTRIKLSRTAIEKILPGEGAEPRRFIPVVKPVPKVVPSELLLLGKRAEEVEELLNRYLDDASVANLSQVRIVHGSGTGVLREIVRNMLGSHPLVKSFRPGEHGEGGNGVTVARL